MCWTSAQKRKLSAIKNKDLKQKGEKYKQLLILQCQTQNRGPQRWPYPILETCDYVALHRKKKKLEYVVKFKDIDMERLPLIIWCETDVINEFKGPYKRRKKGQSQGKWQ